MLRFFRLIFQVIEQSKDHIQFSIEGPTSLLEKEGKKERKKERKRLLDSIPLFDRLDLNQVIGVQYYSDLDIHPLQNTRLNFHQHP